MYAKSAFSAGVKSRTTPLNAELPGARVGAGVPWTCVGAAVGGFVGAAVGGLVGAFVGAFVGALVGVGACAGSGAEQAKVAAPLACAHLALMIQNVRLHLSSTQQWLMCMKRAAGGSCTCVCACSLCHQPTCCSAASAPPGCCRRRCRASGWRCHPCRRSWLPPAGNTPNFRLRPEQADNAAQY